MTIWNDILNLFYPNLCFLCKRPLIKQEKHICLNCICLLPYTHFYKEKENRVFQLFTGKAYVENATSFLHYTKGGLVQKMIHSLKYNNYPEIGYFLGRQAALHLKETVFPRTIDMIIPVPLHPKRKRERGYNQSEHIAKGIHSVWNKPINTTAIIRKEKATPQIDKNLYERWENVSSLFQLTNSSDIEGKHILLVDDVITSGSTLSACVNTLHSGKNVKVSILTIASA